jgi:hypothetical protein
VVGGTGWTGSSHSGHTAPVLFPPVTPVVGSARHISPVISIKVTIAIRAVRGIRFTGGFCGGFGGRSGAFCFAVLSFYVNGSSVPGRSQAIPPPFPTNFFPAREPN